jgi:hypothetical protein
VITVDLADYGTILRISDVGRKHGFMVSHPYIHGPVGGEVVDVEFAGIVRQINEALRQLQLMPEL